METFVVDASVGVKWLFPEEMTENANVLKERLNFGKARIVVPEIFYAEVASACWKRVRRKRILSVEAMRALDLAASFPLKKYSDFELADVGLEHSLRLGVSVYDGLYLALAEIYVSPLVTADEMLYRACEGKFEFIEFLGEIKIG
jgi:predicted nucleic acid-binding protein